MNKRRLQLKGRKNRSTPTVSLTPLVDTALTLLIIFMITSPMLNNSIKLDLPKGVAQEAGKEPQQLVVAIDTNGAIFFNNKEISIEQLPQAIKSYLAGPTKVGKEFSLWVHADAKSYTERLVNVIECVKGIEGVSNVNVAMQKMAPSRA